MSGRLFNRGGLSEGLADYLGLKGQLNASVESEIRPVVLVTDLSDSPYIKDAVPIGFHIQTTAGALEFAYAGLRVTAGTCFQVRRIELLSLVVGGALIRLQLLTGAQVNAVAAGGTTNLLTSLQLVQEYFQDGTLPTRLGPVAVNLVSTVNDTNAQLWVGPVSDVTPTVIDFPDPGVLLIKRHSSNNGGLFAHTIAVNQNMRATFYGKEWPLPG